MRLTLWAGEISVPEWTPCQKLGHVILHETSPVSPRSVCESGDERRHDLDTSRGFDGDDPRAMQGRWGCSVV